MEEITGKANSRWKDNIKIDVIKIELKGVDGIHLAEVGLIVGCCTMEFWIS
jgi:hypothetical protein